MRTGEIHAKRRSERGEVDGRAMIGFGEGVVRGEGWTSGAE